MEAMVVGGDLSQRPPMISQLGAWSYPAYHVAVKVREVSKNTDYEQNNWESGAGGSFTVQKGTEQVNREVKRGTKVGYPTQDQSVACRNIKET